MNRLDVETAIYVHHNTGCSGEVICIWTYGNSGERKEVKWPGALLLAVNRAAVLDDLKNKLIDFAEDL